MDWFMLTAMVIAGWAVVSVFAGERVARLHQIRAAATAAATPAKPKRKAAPDNAPAAAAPRRMAA